MSLRLLRRGRRRVGENLEAVLGLHLRTVDQGLSRSTRRGRAKAGNKGPLESSLRRRGSSVRPDSGASGPPGCSGSSVPRAGGRRPRGGDSGASVREGSAQGGNSLNRIPEGEGRGDWLAGRYLTGLQHLADAFLLPSLEGATAPPHRVRPRAREAPLKGCWLRALRTCRPRVRGVAARLAPPLRSARTRPVAPAETAQALWSPVVLELPG